MSSFINLNNRSENKESMYSASVIKSALLKSETKSSIKADTLVKNIKEPVSLNEALSVFTDKLRAVNALSESLTESIATELVEFNNSKEELTLNEGTMSEIHQLANEVKDISTFVKEFFKRFGDKIKKSADSTEWVESLYSDMKTEEVVTEARSINKIQKDWNQAVVDMQQKVTDWKAAEGDRKLELLDELKNLNKRKSELEAELEDKVAGTHKDVKLAISEDHSEDPNDKYEVKPCDEEGTPFAVWEGDVRVKCFATEEEAQAFADNQNKEQGLEEGNAFLAARAKAIEEDAEEFEFNGKKFPVITGSVITEKIKITKDEWPYIEFKDGGKKHKVEFDYEDIIDDHGNEGQDQYWLGTDEDGKEWSIDVYADYNGNVEEVHYDTIVAESVVTESFVAYTENSKGEYEVVKILKDQRAAKAWRKKNAYLLDDDSVDVESIGTAPKKDWDKTHPELATESVTNEAFSRMAGDTIENELYTATRKLSDYYDWLKAGNDSGKGETLDNVISLLKKCKRMIKRFDSKEEVEGTAYESVVNEKYDGNMSDFKYEFPQKFEEATGNSQKAIKKMAKKGKSKFEVRTSTYMYEPEMKKVADAMGMELVSYEKGKNIAISVFESKEVLNIAEEPVTLDELVEKYSITNESLRSDIKSFIKDNKQELDMLADADEWDTLHQKLYTEFEVEADSPKGKDLLKTFELTF